MPHIFAAPAPNSFVERLRLLFFFKRLRLQEAKNSRLLSHAKKGINLFYEVPCGISENCPETWGILSNQNILPELEKKGMACFFL